MAAQGIILVVDDDPLAQELVRRILTHLDVRLVHQLVSTKGEST